MNTNPTIRQLAYDYHRRKCQLEEVTQETREELATYISEQWQILSAKLDYKITFKDEEINCEQFIEEYKKSGTLIVSTLNNDSILFTKSQNLLGRAIHDYIHLNRCYNCEFEGELLTYKYQSIGMSQQAKQVMFSEIVLQAAYFTEFGQFAPKQKIILLPIEIIQAI